SNNLKQIVEKLEEAIKAKGVRVFISRHTCSLVESKQFKAQDIHPPIVKINQDKCVGCLICINKFGCPALTFDEAHKKAYIDQTFCRGCKVCIDVCPQEAIFEERD
ncbi:MAG: indolepyruvate ferredoxin oxidoreductase subunit alpha, partial [Promethearchaeota archaeon]